MDSIRKQILDAVADRLKIIRTINGFHTDAGEYSYHGITSFVQADCPMVSVFSAEESMDNALYGSGIIQMPVTVEGAVEFPAGGDIAMLSESLIADIKEALFAIRYRMAFESGSASATLGAGDLIIHQVSGASGYVEAVSITSGSFLTDDAAGTVDFRRMTGEMAAGTVNISEDAIGTLALTGSLAGQRPEVLATSGLAKEVRYKSAGISSYPSQEDRILGVKVDVEIYYKENAGDPYHQ